MYFEQLLQSANRVDGGSLSIIPTALFTGWCYLLLSCWAIPRHRARKAIRFAALLPIQFIRGHRSALPPDLNQSTMALADFQFYMQPGSPRFRVPSFPRCLPYLRSELSPVGVLDVIMIRLLVQFINPPMRFCPRHPVGAVRKERNLS